LDGISRKIAENTELAQVQLFTVIEWYI